MGRWVFEELRGAAVRRDPKDAELFKTEQTEEGEYAGTDALVREVLQNSIDAQTGVGPVRVRLAIHESTDAPNLTRLGHYFERLRPPLEARGLDFMATGVPAIPCRFLVCEDFGTWGLEGDTLLFHDPPASRQERQDFYWFWRNIGRSGKTGDDLGRWGLGKTVYRAASRVGCMLGLSVRGSDRRQLLMGQAVLQIHQHGDREYQPEGYWCGNQNESGLPVPIEDGAELQQFRQEWKLARQSEPGLSVVTPYIPDELKSVRLLQAVTVHFFTRILRGELVVEVIGPEIGCVTLDRSGIEAACQRMAWDGPKRTKRHMSPPLEFVKGCITNPPSVVTNLLGTQRAPEFSEDALPNEDLTKLRSDFGAGDQVALRVRLNLPRRTGTPEEGKLDVYLQRRDDGGRCDSYYVREGMTITKINSRAGLRGVQALVIVDQGPLAELLGDTEGPAHEDWDKSAERPDRHWRNWKNKVDFTRRIVDNLVEFLTPPATEPDFDLLSDFFAIQRTQGTQRQPRPGMDQDGEAGMGAINAKPKWFQITQRRDGFTVSPTSQIPVPDRAALRVSLAYDIPRGDPLRSWSPIDFEISNKNGGLKPTGRGVQVKRLQGNVVHLDVLEDNFTFSLEGFDQHRDLFVRVEEVSNTEDAEEPLS